MQVNSTNSATSDSPLGMDVTTLSSEMLSQHDFLKLLVAQMTSQNPLSPLENQDLLSQMVQFSTLQQNTQLQSALAGMQSSQELLQANSLLGREVTLQLDDPDSGQAITVSGVVTDVELGEATRVIVNGTPYDLSQVIWISTPTAASPTP